MYVSHTQLCPGVQLEKEQILCEEKFWADMYGDDVTFHLNTEASIVRDKYSSIKTKDVTTPTPLVIRCYPIVFNPTQYQMEKAGIQEQVHAIITVPMKSWTDASLDDRDLNAIKAEIILRGETYTIKEKSLQRQIGDTFTSINIGIFRK